MLAELACFEERCRARFPITDILYNCPHCGGLLEAVYGKPAQSAQELKSLARAADLERSPGSERGMAIPGIHSVPGRYFAGRHVARGLHTAVAGSAGRE